MGGDHGPSVVIPAAAMALIRHPNIEFLFYGDETAIWRELKSHEALAERSAVFHTTVNVAMDDKPSQALRRGRWKSSMWLMLEAVKKGDAAAAVSAGNTGALMVMSKFCLRMLPGIERPAMAGIWPTINAESVVLDLGANVGADASMLVDFAAMGAALARVLFHIERPSVGLLNIGSEEVKGLEDIKRAGVALKQPGLPIAYHGFVEGDDLGKGIVDVVVTEGFTGNIALKTAEGTAKLIAEYLRAAMRRSFFARIGAVFARGAFMALKEKLDPRRRNGALFLGVNGLVVKSHGGADAMAFASAIDLAYDMAEARLLETIASDVRKFQSALQSARENDAANGVEVTSP